MSLDWKMSKQQSPRVCQVCLSPTVCPVPIVCADSPHWVQVKHGRLQLCQLDGSDADGPDITQVVIATLLLHRSHLWSHPAQRGRVSGPDSQTGVSRSQPLINFQWQICETSVFEDGSWLRAVCGFVRNLILEVIGYRCNNCSSAVLHLKINMFTYIEKDRSCVFYQFIVNQTKTNLSFAHFLS